KPVVDDDVAVDEDDQLRPGQLDAQVAGGGGAAPLSPPVLEVVRRVERLHHLIGAVGRPVVDEDHFVFLRIDRLVKEGEQRLFQNDGLVVGGDDDRNPRLNLTTPWIDD